MGQSGLRHPGSRRLRRAARRRRRRGKRVQLYHRQPFRPGAVLRPADDRAPAADRPGRAAARLYGRAGPCVRPREDGGVSREDVRRRLPRGGCVYDLRRILSAGDAGLCAALAGRRGADAQPIFLGVQALRRSRGRHAHGRALEPGGFPDRSGRLLRHHQRPPSSS